ncbi:MAG: alkaline phosphatase family protein [Myxococcota bacterium]
MVLVLALDGLEPSLLPGFAAEGRLPTLSRLEACGWSGRLRSTHPPVSVPAWSTFLTGLGPGKHGLFDFTRLEKGRIRFQNAADRGGATLLELADADGRRVCSLGLPTTYPVSALRHGAMLSGFDSPFSGAPDKRAMTPLETFTRLGVDLRPRVVPEGRKGIGWHRRAARALLGSIDRRVTQAQALLREGPWDLFIVHFQAADTAGHHFFRYFDPASPRYDARHPDRARVLPDVYAALDTAVAKLIEASSAPPGSANTDVLVLSDHGMGPASDRVCHLNRWLELEGLCVRRRGLDWAGRLRGAAIRWLPPRLQAVLFRKLRNGPAARLESAVRLGAIDLERSVAFSEESSTLPGVWVLDPGERERVIERLRAFDAVLRVHRREDLYRGALRDRAPDLLLEMRHPLVRTPPSYAGPPVRTLRPRELDGARGAGLNGVHRPDGVLLVSGPGFPGVGPLGRPWIGDLAPTLLTRLGVAVPDWMEGRPLPPLEAELVPPQTVPPHPPTVRGREMTHVEQAAMERRLRALGYLG